MAEITGDGTLVTGLGGAAGYGELEMRRGDDNRQTFDVGAVFENGFFFGDAAYDAAGFTVDSNGFVTFGPTSYGFFNNEQLATGTDPVVAGFWTDLLPDRGDGQIYVDIDPEADVVTITWSAVQPFRLPTSYTGPNDFQIQLYDTEAGFDAVLRYADIGYAGSSGNPAAFGVNFGNGDSRIPAESETAALLDLPTLAGNTGVEGLWVFSYVEPATLTGTDGPDDLAATPDDGAVRILGLAGDDTLTGGAEGDQIFGDAGNDSLTGNGGDDVLNGGADDDTVLGGDGDDTLLGSDGDDSLSGDAGNDLLDGGDGNDTVLGGDGNDTLIGQGGDDTLAGGDGDDLLAAGNGDNSLSGGAGADTLSAGTGNDTLEGGAGDDTLEGGDGDDRLDGGAGDDTLEGGAGNDTMLGGAGDDEMFGGAGLNRMEGGAGSDLYRVFGPDDTVVELARGLDDGSTDTVIAFGDFNASGIHIETIELQSGGFSRAIGNGLANLIVGSAGNNLIDGGQNADTMVGGAGNDLYFVRDTGDVVVETFGGGRDGIKAFLSWKLGANIEVLHLMGQDSLNGIGNGTDNLIVGNEAANFIIGRDGDDVLEGQGGADTFVFDRALGSGNVDRIRDFNLNAADEGDILLMKGLEFGGLGAGALDADAFATGTAAADADDRFVFDGGSGQLWFDADGTGDSDQQLVATFNNGADLSADDILIF